MEWSAVTHYSQRERWHVLARNRQHPSFSLQVGFGYSTHCVSSRSDAVAKTVQKEKGKNRSMETITVFLSLLNGIIWSDVSKNGVLAAVIIKIVFSTILKWHRRLLCCHATLVHTTMGRNLLVTRHVASRALSVLRWPCDLPRCPSYDGANEGSHDVPRLACPTVMRMKVFLSHSGAGKNDVTLQKPSITPNYRSK